MLNLLPIAILGFFLGMRHATDPDHVLAVTTIVSREKRVGRAALIGALWGLGHTFTIVVVGGAIILFGIVIPPRVGLSMEFSVAVMLILLGLLNLTGILQWIQNSGLAPRDAGAARSHSHGHGELVHGRHHVLSSPQHGHAEDQTPRGWIGRTFRELGLYLVLRPIVVGIVHGLAGSAAVALLVLATIRDPLWATAYLLVFGVGTIAGMMLITATISLPFSYTSRHSDRINRYMGLASGVLSVAFGLFLVYDIGFVNGLFTSSPSWSPK